MSKPYTTGPAAIFPGIGPGFAPLLLGWAEISPRIQIRPAFSPVFCDLGGTVPIDWNYDGEEAFVTVDITKWNESVYAALVARPRISANNSVRGTNLPGDIGTLMILEGYAFPLWIIFPFSPRNAGGKAVYDDMPAGYRFLAAWVEGPDDLDNLGTKARRTRLVLHCGRTYRTSPSLGGTAFYLYDHDMSAITLSLLN